MTAEDLRIRENALEFAVRTACPEESGKDILERAKAFEKFMLGVDDENSDA